MANSQYLELKNIKVWVEVEGKSLKCHQIVRKGNKVICWVASEVGKVRHQVLYLYLHVQSDIVLPFICFLF